MNKLYYSPEALNDLDEIGSYISQELQNPGAAQNTIDGILDTAEKLRSFAEIGPRLSSITAFESDYRFLVCGSYIIFYRTGNGRVFIDRILLARRDYMRVLFGYTEDNE